MPVMVGLSSNSVCDRLSHCTTLTMLPADSMAKLKLEFHTRFCSAIFPCGLDRPYKRQI